MGDRFNRMTDKHQDFVRRQKIFFTGSAAPTGRVNISPRPTDVFRVIGPNTVAYLDYLGSGNETAAHALQLPRMTIMLCAFEGPPRILRLYGTPHIHPKGSDGYATLLADHYDNRAPRNARKIVLLDIDMVQASCGYGVPLFDYVEDRKSLERWADNKSDEELRAFQDEKSRTSIDGFDTGYRDPILQK
ncbi:MAG: pyridoxamine 5'-phosphate oxidase family protein [Rhodobacteraceae bacterium]|nr:pyridoxamine 5'-phosphate oxidase family protein [Paracoccaceae bacterium]